MTASVSEESVIASLRRRVQIEGLRPFCRRNNLNPGNVCNILSRKRPMQRKVAKAIGFVERTVYVMEDDHD